ncbi:hsp90 co-chaperone Cdc37 [Elasticomyces elasticus]|uniref:Hsp90 chaperone protein kinase-targeting subunit n=1 Tax=Exophiala sideris TaxID=1016849 RepID=A0ABR0IZC5_9EURO|nr:hsp90 co-chaperone Cdc37 [Elasticomyces elasticus]KAK5028141.1 hsp90 co-chaperone Cdc37 [Exophiala sideris]KAK5052799.1 hsp90 co-chaperone Cdc37 [Exophiala sideris]KAK5178410.1 hsp90 co-chaperone Cdc37 [Eurotiomycetes sp. CCFEE 6388]
MSSFYGKTASYLHSRQYKFFHDHHYYPIHSMPISYDKWDRLEVSDDSDVEVHPNVDTKSFIRAKQQQIHQQRAQRKHEIETLKYERIVNDGLLERINALLDALKKHQQDANTKNPDEIVFQSLIESAGDPAKDEPPKPPEGVYTHQKEPQPRYSKMMGTLVDQVKKEVDEKKSADRYNDYVEGVSGHLTKVQQLQQQLLQRLAELEKEMAAKITSEDIHEGFSYSSVNKAKEKPAVPDKPKENAKRETVELLNAPKGLSSRTRDALKSPDEGVSSGAEADVEDDALIEKHEDDDQEDETSLKLTPEGKAFAKIKLGDYRTCLQYITEHPDIVNERTQDALMIEAFNSQMKGQDAYAKGCVHQSLLIQYCRQLGRDGVGMFFKRITTKGHQAQQVFTKDLTETYERIKTRAAELNKEEGTDPAGVEQIQLHAVEPGTEIHINVPQAGSDDPVEQQAREIYERFPPGLQRALETGSLDQVNEVLGKMSVDEAEEIVELLGQGGMLSLQEGVIDATNEEGQKRLKEIEEEEKRKKADKGKEIEAEGEPGDAVEA